MRTKSLVTISFVALLGLAIFGTYLAFGASNADAREGPKNFVVLLKGTDTGVIEGNLNCCWQPAKVGHFRKGEIREIW